LDRQPAFQSRAQALDAYRLHQTDVHARCQAALFFALHGVGSDCNDRRADGAALTSFFVSIGAVNPSLTAIANAIRVGDHLLQRLGEEAAVVMTGGHQVPEASARSAAREPPS
jgi:hypothetical protein